MCVERAEEFECRSLAGLMFNLTLSWQLMRKHTQEEAAGVVSKMILSGRKWIYRLMGEHVEEGRRQPVFHSYVQKFQKLLRRLVYLRRDLLVRNH